MAVFLGILGLMLGFLVMLAGVITFVRGLPTGVALRPGRADPKGNLLYLLNQMSLGLGVSFLALDVVLRLAKRPFLVPGLLLVVAPMGLWLLKQKPALALIAKVKDLQYFSRRSRAKDR